MEEVWWGKDPRDGKKVSSLISSVGCESARKFGKRQAAWHVRRCGQELGGGSCGGELGFPLSCGNGEPLKGF